VLHIGNIRLDNSSILAIETENPNEPSSLWKLMVMACKEQAQEGEQGRFINFRKRERQTLLQGTKIAQDENSGFTFGEQIFVVNQ